MQVLIESHQGVNLMVLTLKFQIMMMNMKELKCNFIHYQILKLLNNKESKLKRRGSSKLNGTMKRLKNWILSLMK